MKAMLQFHLLDWIPLIAYLGFLIYLGLRPHPEKSDESFILSGRKLSLPAFVATLVSTWYGGILGVGEFSYRYGISNWFLFGFPYYLFSLIFAVWIIPRIRKEEIVTIPDFFRKRYGRYLSAFSAFLLYILTSPAPYVFMTAMMIRYFVDIPLVYALVLAVVFSSVYLYRGGFSSVIKTDQFQFVLMFLGFGLIIPFSVIKFGSVSELWEKLPPLHRQLTGGHSWSYILVWFLMAVNTMVDPNFYQRVFAARDLHTARKGILWSVLFWFVFDVMTTLAGLYAFVYVAVPDPSLAYPYLAKAVLPPFWKGVFIVGLLATIMSTVDSFVFTSTITLARDVVQNLTLRSTYLPYLLPSMILTLLAAMGMSLYFPSVISLWYAIATVTVPPLLLAVGITFWVGYFPREKGMWLIMLISFFISVADFFLAVLSGRNGSFFIPGSEPMLTGLSFGILMTTVVIWWEKKY